MILVTGATGRIGSTLIPMLLEKNYKVKTILMPGDKGKERLKNLGVEYLEGKLQDSSICNTAVKDVDTVFHLGAVMFQEWVTNEITFQTNIRGTFNMLEAIAANNIKLKRFVFASSDQVYPSLKAKYSPIDENHPTEPYNIYGLSKLMGEHLCRIYLKEFNIPAVWPRFTLTIKGYELFEPNGDLSDFFYVKSKLKKLKEISNPSDEVKNLAQKFEEFLNNEGEGIYIPCDEEGVPYEVPFTDPRDVAQGLLLLLENDKVVGEAFNFGPPFSRPLDEIVKHLSKKKNLPYLKAKMPSSLFKWNFKININKAKKIFGYNPQWDVFKVIDEM